MSDYITRDSAKGAVSAMLGLENLHTVSIIFEAIDLIRAADVEEVRHGTWIKGKGGLYECSVCHFCKPYDMGEIPDDTVYWECDYCRHCGAKMDGGNDE